MKRAYFVSTGILVVLFILTLVSTIYFQNRLYVMQSEIEQEYLSFDYPTMDQEELVKRVDTLITNQITVKDMWWNTVFGQSAIAIITTLIIIVISLTVGLINQNSIDERIELKTRYLENQNKAAIEDLIYLNTIHKEPSFIAQGIQGRTDEDNRNFLVHCLNSFENLKVLRKDTFNDLLKDDYEKLAHSLISDWLNHEDEFQRKRIEECLLKLHDLSDRYEVLELLPDILSRMLPWFAEQDREGVKTRCLPLDEYRNHLMGNSSFCVRGKEQKRNGKGTKM